MNWMVPGTTIVADRNSPEATETAIRSMFLAGGMVRSQVAAATGIEAHAIQNWVRRGFLSSPVNKRYSCRQFCRIVIINMLKNDLPMEKICSLLSYINGRLNTESDDSIDDTQLYFAFLRVAAVCHGLMEDREALLLCIRESLDDYREPVEGAKLRVEQVLHIMITAWASAELRRESEYLLNQLDMEGVRKWKTM